MRRTIRYVSVGLIAIQILSACAPAPAAPVTAEPSSTAMSATATAIPTLEPAGPPPEHIIGVRVVDGVGEFYSRLTGEKFVPRGNNYTRLVTMTAPCLDTGFPYHAVFNVGVYDAQRTEQTLGAMQRDGYNTVRVFLNGGCLGQKNGGLNEDYVRNVADFLRIASAHDLFVIFTTDDPPVPGYSGAMRDYPDIDWENRQFLTEDGVQANGRFWQDLISALLRMKAPLESILAYELRNEQFFQGDRRPLSMTSGQVKTGNGKTYDMADPADKQKMMDENIVSWIDGVRAAILKADPTALVTVGFFWPQKPHPARGGDMRWVSTEPAIRESSADFIDLHAYPGAELTLPEYVDNFGMAEARQKPIMMGEFGAARASFPTEAQAARSLHDWQVESCKYGFDGWLLWTYDTEEQTDFYNGMTGTGKINEVLAPLNRPDACQAGDFSFFEHNLALGAPARASRWLPNQPPAGAVDGTNRNWWGAGAFAPQWIMIDLGKPQSVGLIRLVITQSPAGITRHEIRVGVSSDKLVLVHTFEGPTVDGQVLEFKPDSPLENVRFVQIRTTKSPSWVGWQEIEVLAP